MQESITKGKERRDKRAEHAMPDTIFEKKKKLALKPTDPRDQTPPIIESVIHQLLTCEFKFNVSLNHRGLNAEVLCSNFA